MLKENVNILRRLLVLFDLCIIAIAFILVHYLRDATGRAEPIEGYLWYLAPLLAMWGYLLYRSETYRSFRTRDLSELVYTVFRTAFFSLLVLSGAMFFLKVPQISREFVAWVYIASALLLCLEKVALMQLFRLIRRHGYNYRNILLVGSNERAQHFIDLVNLHAEWGLRLIGIVDDDASKLGVEVKGIKIIGAFNDMANIIHNNVIDEVVLVVPHSWLDKIKDIITLCELEGIRINLAVDFFQLKFAKAKQTELDDFPMLTFESTPDKPWHMFIKRLSDFALSVISLLILIPVFIVLSILIKVTSRGPVFFRQERSGVGGRRFTLFKFRTMALGAEEQLKDLLEHNEMQGPVFKMTNDPRVTAFGKFLRKTSLDELPQLWNVFKGDMSLVGPRPPLPSEVEKYDNWQRRRLSMRPGITCLWQVNGRNSITDFNEWMKLDLEYIDHWSLWLDSKIFLKTIPVVLFGIGAK